MNNFPSKTVVERIRKLYPIGTRVELAAPLDDPYTRLKIGDRATVVGVDDAGQIMCRWDNGEGLSLIFGVDVFIIIR